MAGTNWRPFVRSVREIAVSGDDLRVQLGDDRSQRVSVDETGETYEFRSVVLGKSGVEKLDAIALRAWRRNRTTRLVGFGLDAKGRLVATAWVPKAGVTANEFVAAVLRVAREADLFEHQLTGADRE